jgi:hypothetical protein
MNQPIRVLSTVLLVCSMLSGCQKQQEESKERGRAVSEAIKAPIDRAKDIDRQQQQAAEEARKQMDKQTE